ncbi:hypothetical protein YC6258_03100 [Gynuella sunshinyii YC6258]|uniref:Cytoplasmic protein n=2 Tax=Gynuella sunshinyii TaxID=1445505 RepID=A0A0C5VLG1_9GAMM|nr:hypothetical protein YC6258_03100 [Gynuella sunshinyii YC6258]
MFDPENLIKLVRVQMPFGKYSGRLIADLPEEYLLWFEKKDFPKGQLGELMQLSLLIQTSGLKKILEPLRVSTSHPQKPNVHIKFDT